VSAECSDRVSFASRLAEHSEAMRLRACPGLVRVLQTITRREAPMGFAGPCVDDASADACDS
jgi:hypothetical protein